MKNTLPPLDIERLLSLRQDLDVALIAGPRPKKDATNVLEFVTHALLDGRQDINFFFKENDLMVNIGGREFNISLALQAEPDFEHLDLSPQQIQEYVRYLEKDAEKKPRLSGQKFPSPEDYQEREKKIGYDSQIPFGAKLAITLYSQDEFYRDANQFLRQNGRVSALKGLDHAALQQKAKELLLAVNVAAYGLSHLAPMRPVIAFEKDFKQEDTKDLESGKIVLIHSKNEELFANYYYKTPTGQVIQGEITIEAIYEALAERNIAAAQLDEILIPGNEVFQSIIENLTKYAENFHWTAVRIEMDTQGVELKSDRYYTARLRAQEEKKLHTEKAFHSTSELDKGTLMSEANIYSIFHENPGIGSQGKLVDVFSKFGGEAEILYAPGTKMRYLEYKVVEKKELKGVPGREAGVTAIYQSAVPTRSLDDYKTYDYSNAYVINELQQIQKNLEAHSKSLSDEKSYFTSGKKLAISYLSTLIGITTDIIKQYNKNKEIDDFQLTGLQQLKKHLSGILKVFKSDPAKKKANKKTIEFLERQLSQINNMLLNLVTIASPHIIEGLHYQELLPAIEYVYDKHLSKPYTRAKADRYSHDEKAKVGDKIIYRPNHGLPHTLRGSFYVPYILDYYAKHAADEKFKNYCKNMPRDELIKIQKILLFVVSGRESDLGFSDNPEIYMGYRQRCGEQFAEFARQDGWSEEDIQKYTQLVIYYGDPRYTEKFPDNSQHSHYISHVMKLAHNIDLLRCYDPHQYVRDVLKENSELVNHNPEQAEDLDQLVLLAQQALEATGDRFFCRLEKGKITFASAEQGTYNPDLFIRASTNPQACLDALTNLGATSSRQVQEEKEHKADSSDLKISVPSPKPETKSSSPSLSSSIFSPLTSSSQSMTTPSQSPSTPSQADAELSELKERSTTSTPKIFKPTTPDGLLKILTPKLVWYHGLKDSDFWMEFKKSEQGEAFVTQLTKLFDPSASGISILREESPAGIRITLQNATVDNLQKVAVAKKEFLELQNPDQGLSLDLS